MESSAVNLDLRELLGSDHPALRGVDVPPLVLDHQPDEDGNDLETTYMSMRRTARRGAISYHKEEALAVLIRGLGDFVIHNDKVPTANIALFAPLTPNDMVTEPCKRKGRRGSLLSTNASVYFNNHLKGTILQSLDIEEPSFMEANLKCINSWDFDVFAFRRMTKGRPLLHLGLYLFHHHKLVDTFHLDIIKLRQFLIMVEDTYDPINCYHNCTHASDVAQALHCLVSEFKIYSKLSALEVLTLMLAALCHDLAHPGVNQTYLVKTSNCLATIHGTQSTLERHHYLTAKGALSETKLLDHLPSEQIHEIVTLMEDMILATDVSGHHNFVSDFKKKLASEAKLDMCKADDRHFIMMAAIKAADISNPARNLYISKLWSENIMEEFFRQGDDERKHHLPVSSFCDRHTTFIPKAQSGFFEYFALPLFKCWSEFVDSPFSRRLCQNIILNKVYWDDQINADSESETDE